MRDELPPTPPAEWGKDHWSTLAYLETLNVDGKTEPDHQRMRTNPQRHPHLADPRCQLSAEPGPFKYHTRLHDKGLINGHDDWDCLDDAVEAGFAEDIGTGMFRAYQLTDLGHEAIDALRRHKEAGGTFATFQQPHDAKAS